MARRPPSLDVILAVVFAGFVVLLLASFGGFVDRIASAELIDAQTRQLDQIAVRLSRRLEVDLEMRLREITLAASGSMLLAGHQPADEQRKLLDQIREQVSDYSWIGFADRDGTIVASTRQLLEQQSVAERPWFKAAQGGPAIVDLHSAALLQRYLASDSAEPLRFVDVAAPVVRDGDVVGILCGHLSWVWASKAKRTILDGIPPSQGIDLIVTDAAGRITLGPHDRLGTMIDVGALERATFEEQRGSGALTSVKHLSGGKEVQGLGWVVIASQPVALALAPIDRARWLGLSGSLLFGLVFIVAGVGTARFIARPLKRLARAADLVGADPSRVVPLVGTYREGLMLSRSLRGALHGLGHQRQALRALNESLEAQVLERTQDLAEAKDAAEAATRAKSDFLATMSHEIRTPLGSIIGLADLLLDDEALTGPQRRRTELIQTAGRLLTTVINDILDLSRIEAGRIDLDVRPFNLVDLVEGCGAFLRPQADPKGVELDVRIAPDVPGTLLGDDTRLRQVLLNLLGNAVKFTRMGSVELDVGMEHAARADDPLVSFRVSDTGIGIASGKLDRLFERFSQVDGSVTREFGGTGLGLAISQRLVELMGGRIAVTSVEGEGSTFTFALPLRRAAAVATSAPADLTTARPLRILVVEDVAINREIVVAMLVGAGHQVASAGDGPTAIKAAEADPFDLVLMDLQMPGMTGLEATSSIRSGRGPNARTPILALTANVLPDQIAACARSGMDGHVGKPILKRDLLDAVAAAVPSSKRPSVVDEAAWAEVEALLGPQRLRVHLEELSRQLRGMQAAQQGLSDLGGAAHKLVGIAGMIGFRDLAERCQKLLQVCERTAAAQATACSEPALRDALDEVLRDVPTVLRWIADLCRDRHEGVGATA